VTLTLIDTVSVHPKLPATLPAAPHGIILLFDPRAPDSVAYAAGVLEHTPPCVPCALLANFQDLAPSPPLPPVFTPFARRVVAIGASLVRNLGLAELSRWLDLPVAAAVYRRYAELHARADAEVRRLRAEFAPGRVAVTEVVWAPREEPQVSLYAEIPREKEREPDALVAAIAESAADREQDLFDELAGDDARDRGRKRRHRRRREPGARPAHGGQRPEYDTI
jgi:hypothetical protein